MNRALLLLLASFALKACNSTSDLPPPTVDRWDLVCSNGWARLYFIEGSSAFAPRQHFALEISARQARECPGAKIKVIGLPAPSDTSLEGRRAQSVVLALKALGLPAPRFDLGLPSDQEEPSIELYGNPEP